MLGSIIKKDFTRNKAINITQWLFIFLSALLMASGSIIVIQSFGSIDGLFQVAKPPHFMQMHTGEINQEEIETFADNIDYVTGQQTAEMVNIDGASIGLLRERGDRIDRVTLSDSMMDNGFAIQNKQFDYLLNLNNETIQVSAGEIAVPIKYMKSDDLEIGDKLILSEGSFYMEFVITDFIRDAQMASSLASSTRFLVSDEEYVQIREKIGRLEYLIEFMLTDTDKIGGFQKLYEESGLPNNGTAVTYTLFKMLNALGEGMKAIIIILVSLLLIFIAIINLRFTILATMEDEIKEIGTMKAIGISHKDIQKLYKMKYVILSAVGCFFGYVAAILCSGIFTADMALNYGKQQLTLRDFIISIVAVALVHLIVIHFCKRVLKKIRHITVVQALIIGETDGKKRKRSRKSKEKILTVEANRFLPTNLFLSIRELVIRAKAWFLLLLVFALAACIMIIPANLYNTIRSSEFATYMGTAISDIRIDLQSVENLNQKHEEIMNRIQTDDEISSFNAYANCRYEVYGEEGWEDMQVECGDYVNFKVSYLNGKGPGRSGEMAISTLNAKKYSVGAGDSLKMKIGGIEENYYICGTYQDVTNGGYTAKMIYDYDQEDVLKYTYFIDTAEGISVKDKAEEHADAFSYAKVIPMANYITQTFGMIIDPLSQVVIAAIAVAAFITLLITVLFLKLNTAREYAQIANMKAMGFSVLDIRKQYVIKTGIVAVIGTLVGVLISNTLGEILVSGLASASGFGLSKIEFVIRPIEAYLLYPSIIIITALAASWFCSAAVKRYNIVRMIQE
ncbi:MAG TPA: ABC transporter permease [Mobilitalea sp.]|nr:ABC transporter permease [Mobilitalea sp.]